MCGSLRSGTEQIMTFFVDSFVLLQCERSNTTAAAAAATEAVAGLPATQMANAVVCSWTPTAAGTYSVAVQLAQSAAAAQQPVNAVCGDADMILCDGVASVVVYAGATSLPHMQVLVSLNHSCIRRGQHIVRVSHVVRDDPHGTDTP